MTTGCEDLRARLDAYVDGEALAGLAEELEAHLRTCPACAAGALGRLQIKRAVQAAGARYLPRPEFRLRVEQGLQARRKPMWLLGWLPGLVAVAVALLVVFGSAALWMRHGARQQALAELVDLHVATLASSNPVDVVSTDRHTVKPWFQGKLPFTFNLPELQNSAFRLVGGRVMYFEHSPGAQLLFELRNHKVSVFVVQQRTAADAFGVGPGQAREMAFNVEAWSEGGLRFVVIGDASPADLHELSELLKAAGRS